VPLRFRPSDHVTVVARIGNTRHAKRHAQGPRRNLYAGLAETGIDHDTDFRILEVLLDKKPLPVNTIGPKVNLTPDRSVQPLASARKICEPVSLQAFKPAMR
jgi:hypothetical protein